MSSSSSSQAARQPAPGQEQQQQQQGGWGSVFNTVLRTFLVIQAVQFFLGGSSPLKSWFGKGAGDASVQEPNTSQKPSGPSTPTMYGDTYWKQGESLDLFFYLSTSQNGQVDFGNTELPHFKMENINFGEWGWQRDWSSVISVPESVQNNGSLWADMFLVKSGVSPDPRQTSFDPAEVSHIRKQLTRFMPQRKIRAEKSLLSSSSDEEKEIQGKEEIDASKKDEKIISYYHSNLTLALISDSAGLALSQLPPVIRQHVHLNALAPRDEDRPNHVSFFPIVFPNDFWLLREQMFPLNETTIEIPIHVKLYPQTHFKFQMLASFDEAFNKQASQAGAGSGELDEIKRMLTETSPILLITTFIVSLLHSLFEFLAFKSDVGHWRNKKELVGVSVRTILTNCFVQLVVLLYLLDNNENTSWMILAGQGVGLLIEAWKITKAVDIRIVRKQGIIPYTIEVHDKHVLTEDEKKTQEYDKLAFRYVSYATIPLLGGYTVYSLLYHSHRGWYSFVISTLTSFVYAFGFVQLIPQLIINYKLKSVAHMPMRAMTYKFFNTIVDDLFAFCIKMPMLHRLACFRDDVVFVILLWQYRIYKVDPTRANEYGQVALSPEEAEKNKDEQEKKDQ